MFGAQEKTAAQNLVLRAQRNLSVPEIIIFQLVPVDPHKFRAIACIVIKLPSKDVGKLFEDSLRINISRYA
jgi:hypothetical protein